MCLSQSLFSAVIQNPIQKSHELFVRGSSAILTSGLAFKNTSFPHNSTVHSSLPIPLSLLVNLFYLPGPVSAPQSCVCIRMLLLFHVYSGLLFYSPLYFLSVCFALITLSVYIFLAAFFLIKFHFLFVTFLCLCSCVLSFFVNLQTLSKLQ